MRVVVDTNVLISALLSSRGAPKRVVDAMLAGRFELITSEWQLAELGRVTRYHKIRERLKPALAGRLINDLREVSTVLPRSRAIQATDDPDDNVILGICVDGRATFLVTGDRRDLLRLGRFRATTIMTPSGFLSACRF